MIVIILSAMLLSTLIREYQDNVLLVLYYNLLTRNLWSKLLSDREGSIHFESAESEWSQINFTIGPPDVQSLCKFLCIEGEI